jgi:hypothetical protein
MLFLLYTPYAADMLKPYAEKAIEKKIGFNITLSKLTLHVNTFALQILLTPQNRIDIKGSYALFSNRLDASYTATLNDLASLKHLLHYELLGSAVITGSITYADENLHVNAHSNIFEGSINALYADNTLRANFSDLQTLKLFKMLQYPQVLRSHLHGNLTYDTQAQSGKVIAQISNAYLAQNKTMNLLKEVSELDVYGAKFNGALEGKMKANIINSTLQLQAPNATINTQNLKIDTQNNTIDTRLHIVANSYPFDINISGNIKAPQVTLDTKEVIKNELGRYLNRLIKEFF